MPFNEACDDFAIPCLIIMYFIVNIYLKTFFKFIP